jgi:hypothetical protein
LCLFRCVFPSHNQAFYYMHSLIYCKESLLIIKEFPANLLFHDFGLFFLNFDSWILGSIKYLFWLFQAHIKVSYQHLPVASLG